MDPCIEFQTQKSPIPDRNPKAFWRTIRIPPHRVHRSIRRSAMFGDKRRNRRDSQIPLGIRKLLQRQSQPVNAEQTVPSVRRKRFASFRLQFQVHAAKFLLPQSNATINTNTSTNTDPTFIEASGQNSATHLPVHYSLFTCINADAFTVTRALHWFAHSLQNLRRTILYKASVQNNAKHLSECDIAHYLQQTLTELHAHYLHARFKACREL